MNIQKILWILWEWREKGEKNRNVPKDMQRKLAVWRIIRVMQTNITQKVSLHSKNTVGSSPWNNLHQMHEHSRPIIKVIRERSPKYITQITSGNSITVKYESLVMVSMLRLTVYLVSFRLFTENYKNDKLHLHDHPLIDQNFWKTNTSETAVSNNFDRPCDSCPEGKEDSAAGHRGLKNSGRDLAQHLIPFFLSKNSFSWFPQTH